MSQYYVHVYHINETEHHGYNEYDETLGDWLLDDDGKPDPGAIYRFCQSEYGRCMSKVYNELTDGTIQHVGWYFIKRMRYDDSTGTYLMGTWVTLHERVPDKYVNIDG